LAVSIANLLGPAYPLSGAGNRTLFDIDEEVLLAPAT
jgi:hypothetical protein